MIIWPLCYNNDSCNNHFLCKYINRQKKVFSLITFKSWLFESLCFTMASCSKPGEDNKASYKTVLKWEKEFGTKFGCDFHSKDVIPISMHCIW